MQIMNTIADRIIRFLIFFSMILVAWRGLKTTVSAQDRIVLLHGGPHAGFWESSDVVLEYQHVAQPGSFKLNIGGSTRRRLINCPFGLNFLMPREKVLEKKSVFNSGFRQKLSSGKGCIEKTFEYPRISTQFAFQSMLMIRQGR